MNRTTNYNLCQFEETDRVRRTDFNEDNAKIDAAIKALSDQKVGQSDLSALAGRVSSLERDRFYIGSYVGDDKDHRTISLPWAPKFMILISEAIEKLEVYIVIPGFTAYIISGAVDTSSSTPYLSGSTLTIRKYHWGNYLGKTSRYILFR